MATIIQALNAVAPVADSRLIDISRDRYPKTIMGLLLADRATSGIDKGMSIKVESGSEADYKLRLDQSYATTNPDIRLGKTWPDTNIDPQIPAFPVEGRFGMAGKEGSLMLPEAEINKLTQSALPFSTEVTKWADKINQSKMESLNTDLMSFEDTGIAPVRSGDVTNDWTTWGQTGGRLAHLAYPLQGGGTGNAVSTTADYQYGDNLNLNAYPAFKAVTAGDNSTPFGAPSPTNIRTKLLWPLEDNDRRSGVSGGMKYAFADDGIIDWIMRAQETYVRFLDPEKMAKYGWTDMVEYCGMIWIRTPELTRAVAAGAKRKIIVINPMSLLFRHYNMNKTLTFDGDDIADRFGIAKLWRWNFAASLIIKEPFRNASAWDVSLP